MHVGLYRLNFAGTELASKSVVQTIIDTAPDRSKTLAFNYASQALNNSFFLDTLVRQPLSSMHCPSLNHAKKPPPTNAFNNEADISTPLGVAIRQDFGSLEQLKSTVSAAAMGMSSSGWIWVAVDGRATMGVIPTFGAGTLLVRSRGRVLQSVDPVLGENYPTPEKPTPLPHQPTPPSPAPGSHASPSTATRGFHTSARVESVYGGKAVGLYGLDPEGEAFEGEVPMADFEKIGTHLYPLFCLSVHEHCWLTAGYGIWGKEEYLKRFWTVLDWKKVSDAFHLFAPRRTGN